jgi:hypothetical protein
MGRDTGKRGRTERAEKKNSTCLLTDCSSQGTTFSGVAFAFATNNEAKEDIITEWPGAGSYTKQKVSSAEIIMAPHNRPS